MKIRDIIENLEAQVNDLKQENQSLKNEIKVLKIRLLSKSSNFESNEKKPVEDNLERIVDEELVSLNNHEEEKATEDGCNDVCDSDDYEKIIPIAVKVAAQTIGADIVPFTTMSSEETEDSSEYIPEEVVAEPAREVRRRKPRKKVE